MANIKISALPAATFANDADLIPIVQSGVTKKVTPAILLANVWAETTAINGLIDGILATPTSPSPYTASGTLLNNGVASSRIFSFKTDRDLTYNPSTIFTDLYLGKNVNSITGTLTDSLGGLCIKGSNNATVNINAGGITLAQYNDVSTNLFQIKINPFKTEIEGGTTTGIVRFEVGTNGLLVTDSRSTQLGWVYNGNYSTTIIANDRSIPDVGIVKQLITANGGSSIYTASGNVFDTGTATTRRFSFITDQNATYNPNGFNAKFLFGKKVSSGGTESDSAGTISFVGTSVNSSGVVAANFDAHNNAIVFTGYNGTEQRKITVTPFEAKIETDTPDGIINIALSNNGAKITDNRTPPLNRGLEYADDYLVGMASNDRSLPDVATVKYLRTQSNSWTTVGRPAAQTGVHGFNITTSKFEGYNGTAWVDFA